MMQQPAWNFEQEPWEESPDETSVNLRAYFDRLPDDKLSQYTPSWSDDELIAWDGNFTEEAALLLPCSERAVEAGEYRRVLEQCLRYRAGEGRRKQEARS